jgi:hypothetical protein
MPRRPSNIRSRQSGLPPHPAQNDAQTYNRSSGKQSHRRRERGKLRKSYLGRARPSSEVEKYLAEKN